MVDVRALVAFIVTCGSGIAYAVENECEISARQALRFKCHFGVVGFGPRWLCGSANDLEPQRAGCMCVAYSLVLWTSSSHNLTLALLHTGEHTHKHVHLHAFILMVIESARSHSELIWV